MMRFRWIDNATATDADWDRIERVLATRGWMALNRATPVRIRIAEDDDGKLCGFFVLQLVPHAGPAWVVPSERGTGLIDVLADDMRNFLVESDARGWMVVADNSIVARMCEARGMVRVTMPVYTTEPLGQGQGGR
jgi:hypothetical protein